MSDRTIEGATIAVVGASGGIGAPLSRRLAERGAHLLLAGRDPDRLQALGLVGASVVPLDLRDPLAGDRLTAATEQLDGLIVAAGVVAFGDLVDTDDEIIEELFLTNVLGPLWLLRRMVPLLSASQGFVVHLSAVVAEQPLPGLAAYAASKAALTAADAALARELRRSGVHLCDVRPPHTETGLASRPLAGTAPRLPAGLDPEVVADRVIDAILAEEREVPSDAFAD